MLSGETAKWDYPAVCVKTMAMPLRYYWSLIGHLVTWILASDWSLFKPLVQLKIAMQDFLGLVKLMSVLGPMKKLYSQLNAEKDSTIHLVYPIVNSKGNFQNIMALFLMIVLKQAVFKTIELCVIDELGWTVPSLEMQMEASAGLSLRSLLCLPWCYIVIAEGLDCLSDRLQSGDSRERVRTGGKGPQEFCKQTDLLTIILTTQKL